MLGAAGFASAGIVPTLTMRMDSLFAQCTIDAVIHFVPQDAVCVLGWFLYERNERNKVNYTTRLDNPKKHWNAWLAKKGMVEGDLNLYKGSSKWTATYAPR